MPFFTRSRFRLSSWAVTVGIMATAAALANPVEAPSLAEHISAICSAAFRSAPPQEARFLSENVSVMTRMMTGMEIKPSGDLDQDFAAMMIPHHQGAMEMAQAELRHGHNEQLRRIAQEIIVTEQQEIAAMRLALGQPLPPSAAAPRPTIGPVGRGTTPNVEMTTTLNQERPADIIGIRRRAEHFEKGRSK